MVRRNRAPARSAGSTPESAEPAASAAAVVVVMTISRVLAESPPAIGPKIAAYRPWIGFTPTSTAQAMPSGTLEMAPGTPATASSRRVARDGAKGRRRAAVARRRERADSMPARPEAVRSDLFTRPG